MLEACWLWFVISKEYVELTRPKMESRDPIFFTGTRLRSRVFGNDRLFPRGSEFGPNPEIPASPLIQLRPRPANQVEALTGFRAHPSPITRLRPNWIVGLRSKSGSARKSESSGPENVLSNIEAGPSIRIMCINFNAKTQITRISVAVRYKKSISIIETVISIDYRYIDFLASYFSDRSRGIDRVGDNWRTVNTSANPHISDQLTELRTEYTC